MITKRHDAIYTLLFAKKFDRTQLQVVWQPVMLNMPSGMNREIERHWLTLTGYHNGCMARLDEWKVFEDSPCLYLRPTEYKMLLYSNRHVDEIISRWGEVYLSRALGISANVITRDRKLLLMRRSAQVGEYAGYYDVFGGHIDCSANEPAPDVFLAMAKELEEELGIPRSEMFLQGVGLVEARAQRKPELLFNASIGLDSVAIFAIAQTARDRYEYSQIFTIENNRDDILTFLHGHADQISPSAYGCLSVYAMQMQ